MPVKQNPDNDVDANINRSTSTNINTNDDIDTDINDEDESSTEEQEMLEDAEELEKPEENIGKKINQLRLSKGFSQRKLARLAGLTNTSISAIERNKVSPAVNTLKAILLVLDSDLNTFFSDEWKERKDRVVVTPKDLVEISEPNSRVSIKQVFNGSPIKNLGFLIEVYQPNSSTEDRISHEGEEIGTVIEGKIIIRIDDTTYLLNEGDSYIIKTCHPHTFINPSNSITRIVSAHSPATF